VEGSHVLCRWKDETPPEDPGAIWELVAATDDRDLAVQVFEHLKFELRRDKC